MPRIDLIQIRRDTEAVMLATPNVLALGEPFFIIDTNEIVFGDGVSIGSALSRFTVGGPGGSVATDAIWDAADDLAIGTGANTASRVAFGASTFPAKASTGALLAKVISDAALSVLAAATLDAMLATLGGGSAVGTGVLVRKAYVDDSVIGLLDDKGAIDCSANPNYPAGLKGDVYTVTVAGRIGGASGKLVEVGDWIRASADNAGGTEAAVGTSWFVLEHNLVGAVLTGSAASLASLATSAATPLLLTNGQLVNIALTSQTVGATTLTIPNFASVVDTFVFTTLAQTLSNKTFIAPILGVALATSLRVTEVTSTPAGTTQTITLANSNHQTLALTSATGTVTATLAVPSSSSAGTVIVKQHATAAKDITWAVSAGSIVWLGTEPDWGADAVSKIRIMAWRFDGTDTYLSSTDTN